MQPYFIFDFASSHPSVTRSSCHLPQWEAFYFPPNPVRLPLRELSTLSTEGWLYCLSSKSHLCRLIIFFPYRTALSTFLFLSTKIFQFSAKSRKAPLKGSCRHCRLKGGSLLNFNHTNMRPMVSPKHVPLKQQRIPITQTGDHRSPLRNSHKR